MDRSRIPYYLYRRDESKCILFHGTSATKAVYRLMPDEYGGQTIEYDWIKRRITTPVSRNVCFKIRCLFLLGYDEDNKVFVTLKLCVYGNTIVCLINQFDAMIYTLKISSI